MQAGKRSAQWDHTAAIILHTRLVAGDKEARFEAYHPDYAAKIQRNKLRQFSKSERAKSKEPKP